MHATESTLQLAIEQKVDIIAIQEPWIAPSNNKPLRSIAHQSFYQILPNSSISRPRALFYISRSLKAEIKRIDEIADPDAIAITIQQERSSYNIYNIYNQKNTENIKTFKRILANTRLPVSTLLLMDANEHHPWWDPLCSTTSQGAQELVDWIGNQNLSLLNTPGTTTFFRPHLSRETTLDLTIATLDLVDKVKDWQTIIETGSDHYGILFSLQTTKDLVDSPTIQTKYNTKRANWELFQEELDRAIQKNVALQTLDQIDQRKVDSINLLQDKDQELEQQLEAIGQAITLVIQQAADKAIPRLKLGPKAKPWWNQELTKLRKNVSHCQRIFAQQLQATSIEESYLYKKDFLIARNSYQNAIKQAKRKHWNDFLEKEDPKSIFKAMVYTKEQQVERIPPIYLGETLETTFKGKCKAFRRTLFPPPPTTKPPSFSDYSEKSWDWPKLSRTEVEQACSNKVKSSSPSPDAISQEIITAAFQAQPDTLLKAYSLLFNYGYHPTC